MAIAAAVVAAVVVAPVAVAAAAAAVAVAPAIAVAVAPAIPVAVAGAPMAHAFSKHLPRPSHPSVCRPFLRARLLFSSGVRDAWCV